MVVRDSAGIAIVESVAPVSDVARWTLDDTPDVILGEDPEATLVWVAGAALSPNGGAVVVDEGSHRILWFGRDGALVRSAGRAGSGPGEFRTATLLSVRADTVFTLDPDARRVAVWRDGLRISEWSLPGDLDRVGGRGRLNDGRVVLEVRTPPAAVGGEGEREDSVLLVLTGPGAAGADPVGRFPGSRVQVSAIPGGVSSHSIPFSAALFAMPFGDGLVIGHGSKPEFWFVSAAGRLHRIVRLPEPPRSYDARILATYREDRLAPLQGADRERVAAVLDRVQDPRPAFSGLLVSGDSMLWIRVEGDVPGEAEHWRVYRADGNLRADATLPLRTRLLAVDGRRVLVLHEDADDVQTVRIHLLHEASVPRS